MEKHYYKEYSQCLGCDMEWEVYGHAGRPVLFIPCQDGHFYDFENFKMADTMASWIESGQIMVFSINTMDEQSWSDKNGDPYWRIRRYEQWISYITDEMTPFIQRYCMDANGWDDIPGIMVFGASLGATHAVNLYLRRPDIFDRLLALSGIYTAEYGFGDYMDECVYQNSPIHYMGGMSPDHPYIEQYNGKRAVICVGQGPWELPESTEQLQGIMDRLGIYAWFDYWGFDCAHDWDWWYKQVAYFMPYLLED